MAMCPRCSRRREGSVALVVAGAAGQRGILTSRTITMSRDGDGGSGSRCTTRQDDRAIAVVGVYPTRPLDVLGRAFAVLEESRATMTKRRRKMRVLTVPNLAPLDTSAMIARQSNETMVAAVPAVATGAGRGSRARAGSEQTPDTLPVGCWTHALPPQPPAPRPPVPRAPPV